MQHHSLTSLHVDPDVMTRRAEFLGGNSLEDATCVFLVANGISPEEEMPPFPPRELAQAVPGWEIFRSLWDRNSLVVDLDVEYVNFDFPAEPYLDPERIFTLQQPVEAGIEEFLGKFGIFPLHLMSGRGHHFLWRVRRDSPAFTALGKLGRVPPGLAALDAQPHPPGSESIDPALGSAYHGLGQVMEFVAQHIQVLCADRCDVPLEITDTAAGPRHRHREIISLDLSEYGDPLGWRCVRIPFSPYLKPKKQRAQLGERLMAEVPQMISVPKHDLTTLAAARLLWDLDAAADLARRADCRIPDFSEAMEELIGEYRASPLAKFHLWFYSQEQEPMAARHAIYDQVPEEPLPPCVRTILSRPAGLLLNPSGLQRVTRVMLALGWHPRHIAGLISSRYERDANWGRGWSASDPGHRADFYVRLFSGAFIAGNDNLVSFNCRSAQEAERCFNTECSYNLLDYKHSLIERRSHERLGGRPLHRLFLPAALP
ncbi:MAG: hypothetical protein WAM82_21805 [Thermoanaerobaculia bacterium]